MIRFRAIVSLLLVAFWLPSSSHALLEHLGVIHQVHADHDADSSDSHEHNTDNHEAADGECALSSTHVSVPLPDSIALPMLFCVSCLNWASELYVEPQPSGLAPPGTSPPLPNIWQFVHRAALPGRAPSLTS